MLELDKTMEGRSKKCDIAGFEAEERRRKPKGCRWSLEVGKGKETFLP